MGYIDTTQREFLGHRIGLQTAARKKETLLRQIEAGPPLQPLKPERRRLLGNLVRFNAVGLPPVKSGQLRC